MCCLIYILDIHDYKIKSHHKGNETALHYIALFPSLMHYVKLHCLANTSPNHVTLHTFHCNVLHFTKSYCVTLNCVTLHCVTGQLDFRNSDSTSLFISSAYYKKKYHVLFRRFTLHCKIYVTFLLRYDPLLN